MSCLSSGATAQLWRSCHPIAGACQELWLSFPPAAAAQANLKASRDTRGCHQVGSDTAPCSRSSPADPAAAHRGRLVVPTSSSS